MSKYIENLSHIIMHKLLKPKKTNWNFVIWNTKEIMKKARDLDQGQEDPDWTDVFDQLGVKQKLFALGCALFGVILFWVLLILLFG